MSNPYAHKCCKAAGIKSECRHCHYWKAGARDRVLVLHTDQGSVYASKAFNKLLPMYNIQHFMSRAGTPTDNAAMESFNGWIKTELSVDFHLEDKTDVPKSVARYIQFFNEERPAYSLGYLTPRQYREQYGAIQT